MAKEQLTREMLKNHLKKQLKNALPKTFITLIPIAFLIWFQIFSFEIFHKDIDDYLNPFAAMCIWFFIAIIVGAAVAATPPAIQARANGSATIVQDILFSYFKNLMFYHHGWQ